MADLGKEIRIARKRLRMNQKQFADALGASQGSVSKWEAGKEVPRFEVIEKINELSGGFASLTKNYTPKDGPAPYEIKQVPVRGYFYDAAPATFFQEDETQVVHLPLSEGWAEGKLEGWYLSGTYDEIKPESLGVFAGIGRKERLDDLARGTFVLITVQRESHAPRAAEPRFFLTRLYGNSTYGYGLWPIGFRGRESLFPIPIDENGVIAATNVEVIGILLGVFSSMTHVLPADVEPD